jgi:hypothetical protein
MEDEARGLSGHLRQEHADRRARAEARVAAQGAWLAEVRSCAEELAAATRRLRLKPPNANLAQVGFWTVVLPASPEPVWVAVDPKGRAHSFAHHPGELGQLRALEPPPYGEVDAGAVRPAFVALLAELLAR